MRSGKLFGSRATLAAIIVLSMLSAPAVLATRSEGAAKVNINQADREELMTLPGIGPALAARILEYRKENGPFQRIEDLMNVRGIGEKSFLKLQDQITIGTQGSKG